MNNMCPAMVFEDGKPVICQDAPATRRIMHCDVQVLLNLLAHGLGPQDAGAALTVDASGRETLIDSRFPIEAIEALRDYGHLLKVVDEDPGMTGNLARPSAVTIHYEHRLLRAGVDVFRPTWALGY